MSQYKGASHYGQTVKAPVMEFTWTRNQGESETISECGAYAYLKNVRLPELQLEYDRIVIRQERGDCYRLEAARTGEEQQDVHEVQGTNLIQSVLINRIMKPKFLAAGVADGNTETTYAGIVSRISDEVTKKKSGAQSYAEMRTNVSGIMAAPGITVPDIGFTLMDHLDRNGDQYLAEQYVYRHTVVIPDRSYQGDLGYIYNNTHKVFTESQVRSAESIPDFYALPPSTINNAAGAKWLKQPVSDSLNATTMRRSITLEYLFADDWTALLYANL